MAKLNKSVQITLIVSVAAITLAIILILAFKVPTSNTIQVSGQSTVEVAPDLITVYFNVDTKGSTSKAAEDANSAIVNVLKSSIIALGFQESDLKTENYNIYPEYDYDNGKKLTGYRAIHSLKIQVSAEQKDKVSDIIDAGTNAGAGISYINFELSPALEQQKKTDAIKAASDDAKIKAEAIAQGFNKNLGRLVSVSLNEFNYQPWPIYASSGTGGVAEAKSAVTSITPSDREVSAYVTAIYKLR